MHFSSFCRFQGIGLIGNTDELDGIATPPIEENRFTVDDFSGLDGIKEKVFVEVCEGKKTI